MVSQLQNSKKPLIQDNHWQLPPKPWRLLIVMVLAIAIFCRFANLEQKVYWYDEVSTSLTVTGYTEAEIVRSLDPDDPIKPEILQQYQQINDKKTVPDTVRRLIAENPHHPPFYYLIARLWSKIFGTSILAMRSLPAIISLLIFPCTYWLCLELFESSITGWITMVLMAVSPLHLVYAQEARQYSLWICLILLSSAALLRAIRVKTTASWTFYGITLTLSLYTQLFFTLVAFGHGIYLLVNQRLQFNKIVKSYLITSVTGLLLFTPWIFILLTQYTQADRLTEWTRIYDLTYQDLFQIWIHNLSLAFFDLGGGEYSTKFLLLYIFFIALVGYSLVFICRNTPSRIWLFILTLMGASALPLVLPDLLLEGQRSITPRYLIPCYLVIQLAVAGAIARKLNTITFNPRKPKFWQLLIIILISLGIFSSVIYSQSKIWWHKFLNVENIPISQIVNQTENPILVSNVPTNFIISLSYALEPKVQLLVAPRCRNCTLYLKEETRLSIPTISQEFSDIFLVQAYPAESWQKELATQKDYKTNLVFEGEVLWLWKLEKSYSHSK